MLPLLASRLLFIFECLLILQSASRAWICGHYDAVNANLCDSLPSFSTFSLHIPLLSSPLLCSLLLSSPQLPLGICLAGLFNYAFLSAVERAQSDFARANFGTCSSCGLTHGVCVIYDLISSA